MKKHGKRRLALAVATIRPLEKRQLGAVKGGTGEVIDPPTRTQAIVPTADEPQCAVL